MLVRSGCTDVRAVTHVPICPHVGSRGLARRRGPLVNARRFERAGAGHQARRQQHRRTSRWALRIGFVGRKPSCVSRNDSRPPPLGHPRWSIVQAEAGRESRHFSLGSWIPLGRCPSRAGGDEDEMLLSYGVVDQLEPGTSRGPATDPMAVGAALLDLLDQLQSDGRVVVLAIDDLHWVDRPSSCAILFALRRLRADKVLTVVSARAGGRDRSWLGSVPRRRFTGHTDPPRWSQCERSHRARERSRPRLAHVQGRRLVWLTTPKGTHSIAGRCSTRSASAALNKEDGGLPAPRELNVVILARVSALSTPTQSFLRGRFGAGAALAGIDDHNGRRATGRTRRRRCCCQGRADERRRGRIGAVVHSSALSGRHLRRLEPHSSPDAACPCSRVRCGARPPCTPYCRCPPVQTSRSRANSKHQL